MKKILNIVLIICLSFIIIPNKAIAIEAYSDAYMIITNPGEDASSEMNISWHMDEGVIGAKLIYTTKDDIKWDNVIEVNPDYELITDFKNRSVLKYSVTLHGLKEKTEYMYKVGADNFSLPRYFKTAGASEFSFIWTGDWHSYIPLPNRTENVTRIIQKALEVEPNVDFMFSTGDMVAYGSDYEAWELLYDNPQYKNYMWATTVGNHDRMNNDEGSNGDQFFKAVNNNPKNGYIGQEGVSYYFKYSNALFIVLNSSLIYNDETARAKAQEWAAEVIENNHSQYVFVSMHYNWFHGNTGGSYQYNNWNKFFDDYNVDLAMSGHDHIYVRTNSIYNGELSVDDTKGTVYMQCPSTDNDRGRTKEEEFINEDKIVKRWTEGTNTMGAIIVTVNSENITTRLIDREGTVQDEAKIPAKITIDTFDKQYFESSFVYINSNLNLDMDIVSNSTYGIGFIDKIDYFNEEGKLLGTNYLRNKEQANFMIPNIDSREVINVKITYIDDVVSNIKLNKISEDFRLVSNLNIKIENKEKVLTWDYLGNDKDLKGWVFVDGEPYKEVILNDLSLSIDNIKTDSIFEIRASKESLYTQNLTKYNLYGDINLDGKVDEEDIVLLQNYLLGIIETSDRIFRIADIDLDGKISIIDMSYIHLYIKGNLDNIVNQKYTVSIYDHLGRKLEEKEVYANSSVIPPILDLPSGYELIAWDKDLSRINDDLIVRAIVDFPFNEVSGE